MSTKNFFPVLCFFAIACAKKPDACFVISQDTVQVNQNIEFTSCSYNAKRYSWDLGDGQKINKDKNTVTVSHSYSNAGGYTVTLTVFNGNKQSSKSQQVTILVKK